MKKISTIIVDDEPLALKLLATYLADIDEIEVLAQCQNGSQAIEQAVALQPELMFLDIQMPELNGFDVVKALQGDSMPLIVFVTAYDQYALEAFDVYAIDYILKPLNQEHLQRAIARCVERLGRQEEERGNKADIINAIGSLDSPQSEPSPQAEDPQDLKDQRIVVRDRSAITLLEQSEIDWVDAAGDYMCIHADGTTHIMRSTLKALLEQLNPEIFQRVHRSTIVNLQRIQQIIPLPKGEYYLQLTEKDRVKVSRNYRSVIKDYLGQQAGG